MKKFVSTLTPTILFSIIIVAGFVARAGSENFDFEALEISRFKASEAHQGVAVDEKYFYAISNHAIGKYDKRTGASIVKWKGPENGQWKHINSCKALSQRLRCAHSNSPNVPTASSIEYFDKDTLRPVGTRSLGILDGSITWIDEKDGDFWVLLARYDRRTPQQGTAHTQLVRFDARWRRIGGWVFPESLMTRLAPHSVSGGAWGPDELLYVTGHHRKEMYVLRLPDAGAALEHVATIAVPIEGQAFAFDTASDEPLVYGISRENKEVVVFRLQPMRD